ncbi:Peroxisome biogenesis protein 22 [Galdieria sulphuraria]|nr:Peroxisome biogenesis protein 22 [Galdieria sulphuraria]
MAKSWWSSLWKLISWLSSLMSSLLDRNGVSVIFAAVAAVALLVSLRNRKRRNNPTTTSSSSRPVHVTESSCIEYGGNKSSSDSVPTGPFATMARGTSSWKLKNVFRGVSRITLGTDLEKSCLFRRVSSSVKEQLQVDPDKLSGFLQLISLFEVFLIIRVSSDEEEVSCRNALEVTGTFQSGLHPAKVLFCETLQGTTAIVRQLEPQMHIDSNPSVIVDLERFIQRLVYIGSGGFCSRMNKPIVLLEQLADIFQ